MERVLTVEDMRATGVCARGIRDGCRERGIDFHDFAQNGMPMSEVQKYLPDAIIERAIDHMNERLG